MLTEKEKKRYSRQILLKNIGEKGQEKLKAAKVLIVGAGGLGSPLALYMCAAGIGTLGVIDDDQVAESNLQRQVLYTSEDVNLNKVEAAARRLKALNPYVNVQTYCDRLQSGNAQEVIQEYDLILDGCDNYTTRYLINDICVKLDKVFIYGTVAEYNGQVSVFNYSGGPTYRCLYPEAGRVEESQEPLGVFGALPGIVASIQAAEAIKYICGVGTLLSGYVLLIDLLTNQFEKIMLKRQYAKD